ncbi:hypothetical protein [Janthinobacterium lividum]|uniref:hypothetical protein n=1 Tax=Janthinobacterium lividum TaxID=29581 RepID=UPI0016732475|nr:hypothetical protein [Janthinobacterium lividum]
MFHYPDGGGGRIFDGWRGAFASGNLGLGEAYMDGDWDAQQLDEFFCHLLRA